MRRDRDYLSLFIVTGFLFFIFLSITLALSSMQYSHLGLNKNLCRRIKSLEGQPSGERTFLQYGQRLKFDGEERAFSREEVDYLNKELTEFVLEITGATKILEVSAPIPHLGTAPELGGRVRTYEFKVRTDKGNVSVFLKWIEEDIEAERFVKASALGIAPPSKEILLGYVVSKGIQGIKLAELSQDREWFSVPSNYISLASQLGEVVTLLESLGYSETLEHNLIVEEQGDKIKLWVVDYEDAQVSIGLIPERDGYDHDYELNENETQKVNYGYKGLIRDIFPLYQQIQTWISKLAIPEDIKNKMLEIFVRSYQKAGGSYH